MEAPRGRVPERVSGPDQLAGDAGVVHGVTGAEDQTELGGGPCALSLVPSQGPSFFAVLLCAGWPLELSHVGLGGRPPSGHRLGRRLDHRPPAPAAPGPSAEFADLALNGL